VAQRATVACRLAEAQGDQIDLAALKKAVDGINLAKLEALQRPAK
jgi:hypothetical protein